MGKIVRSVLPAVGTLIGTALGTLIGGPIGGRIGALIGGSLGSVGRSSLSPKAKAPRNSPEAMNRLRANIDPLTPRKTIIGISAMPVDIR